MDKGKEHQVRFVISGENSGEVVDTAEWAVDIVPPPVDGEPIYPDDDTALPGRYRGDDAEAQVQWAGFVALDDPPHGQTDWLDQSPRDQRPASFGGIVSILKSLGVKRSR